MYVVSQCGPGGLQRVVEPVSWRHLQAGGVGAAGVSLGAAAAAAREPQGQQEADPAAVPLPAGLHPPLHHPHQRTTPRHAEGGG